MAGHKTGIRSRNLYNPLSGKPFKLSRSRLEGFIQCPRCFYLDRRLGIDRPSMPGWTLNSAVDALLKKEFDSFRLKGIPHPLMIEHGIDAVPFQHDQMDVWRENFKGVEYLHPQTNLVISGAVDDIWVNSRDSLHVVDYKSTSTQEEIRLDTEYRQGYKRQMEIYQWLLRMNGYNVSDTGFFVYANALKTPDEFNARLTFSMQVIEYAGNASWVEQCVVDAHQCLILEEIPAPNPECEYCLYRSAARGVEI